MKFILSYKQLNVHFLSAQLVKKFSSVIKLMIEFLELGGATMRMKPIGTLLGAILLFSACNNKE